MNPCPGGHENYNFGGPFLGHHFYILSLSDLCLVVEKMIFKEIMYFQYITHIVKMHYFFKNLFLYSGAGFRQSKCIVIMNEERSTKFINFMTPRVGSCAKV